MKKPGGGASVIVSKSRLLPASVPMRFFATAVVFHFLAWGALLVDPARVPRFGGGLGWPLAALHGVTLGVLVMSAIGASLQLLPVATRQAVWSRRAPALLWWLYTPSVAALMVGMGAGHVAALAAGAAGVVVTVLAWMALLARNLAGARGMPGVVLHAWGAVAALVGLLASAGSLAFAYAGVPPLIERGSALALHLVLAAYGVMGLLTLGLSYVLVPMFTLAPVPDDRRVLASGACAIAALVLATLAAFGVVPELMRGAALALGAVSVALHLWLMRRAGADGMRKPNGAWWTLARVAWGALVASLALAALELAALPLPGAPTLFGLVLVGGWLLGFLLAVLQRIVPFLASMHAGGRRPPTPSALTAERPLALHLWAHLGALALLALAVLLDSAVLAAVAAVLGAAGALAYAVFFWLALQRAGLLTRATPVAAATA